MAVLQIQLRRDTASNWTTNNPTLAQGEFGYETDTGLLKLGNGGTAWNSLAYFGGSSGYSSTATAAGTTTLTVNSNSNQFFTGSTTQTVVLPAVSTLPLGKQYTIYNASTGVVTVQSSGANTIFAQPAGTAFTYTSIATSGTGTSSWSAYYDGNFSGVTGTGAEVLATNPVLTGTTLTGAYSGAYTDGVVVDYVTGNGRISVGTGDGVTFYNNTDSSRSQIFGISSTGGLTILGSVTANSSTGTSGQVLTSTGTGVQWAAVAADPTPTVFMLMGA